MLLEENKDISKDRFLELLKNNSIKHIKDTEDYYITESGYVLRAKHKQIENKNIIYKVIVRKRTLNSKKIYYISMLSKSLNKLVKRSIHRLVAEYFLEEGKYDIPGKILKFKDNDRSNIHKDNLYWDDDFKRESFSIALGGKRIIEELKFLSEDLFNRFIKKKQLVPIKNSPGFYIHERGFVVNGANKRIMSTFPNQDGYRRLALPSKKHGVINAKTGTLKRVNFSIHLLVAEAFLKEKSYSVEGKTINHKDGNRINNYYKNLEWVTNKVNVNHAHDLGLVKTNTEIIMVDIHSGKSKKYRSLRDVARDVKRSFESISVNVAVSKKYPIFNKYVLHIKNFDRFINNVKHNSKPLYVYDHVKGELKKIDSINKISILYGIMLDKSYKTINKRGYLYKGGCSIGITKDFIHPNVSKEKALEDRYRIWNNYKISDNKILDIV